jgi:WD40 repeat protein
MLSIERRRRCVILALMFLLAIVIILATWITWPSDVLVTGKCDSWVTAVALSQNGKSLAVGSQSGELLLWPDRHLSQVPKYLTPVGKKITSLSFSAEGTLLAAASLSGTVTLWRVQDQTALGKYPGDVAALSPDGKLLATAVYTDVLLFTVGADKQPITCRSHKEGVCSIGFAPTSDVFASGAEDGSVIIWDTLGVAHYRLQGHDFGMRLLCVRFMQNDHELITAGEDGLIFHWQLDRDQNSYRPTRLAERQGAIEAVDVDGKSHVYVCVGEKHILRYSLGMPAHNGCWPRKAWKLAVSEDGELILVGDLHGRFELRRTHSLFDD